MLLGAILLPRCGLTDVDALGKPCPCPASLTCDPSTNTCVTALTDAGASDAAPDATDDAGCAPFTKRSTLAVGRAHACAIRSGRLYCWGANDIGQVGIGTTSSSVDTPTQVLPAVDNFMHVSSMDQHTCALNEKAAA